MEVCMCLCVHGQDIADPIETWGLYVHTHTHTHTLTLTQLFIAYVLHAWLGVPSVSLLSINIKSFLLSQTHTLADVIFLPLSIKVLGVYPSKHVKVKR